MLYRIFFILLIPYLLTSCGNRKKSMSGSEEVDQQEFFDFFQEVRTPFFYADTSLKAVSDDSLLISSEIFNRFTPDSILKAGFNEEKVTLYAIGKFRDKNENIYLLSKAISEKRKTMLITSYNKKNEFISGFTAMKIQKNNGASTQVMIDPLFNIHQKTVKKLPNGIEISGDDVYILNEAAKSFMLVLTDSLGNEAELINPIDTLGKNYEHAGDYGKGSRNIISIRDDVRPGRVQFFIHLEESKSDCTGELKGEAIITSENTAEYRQPGDPCVLQFTFNKRSVVLTEIEGCGSRMGGLDCSFNGTYTKKADAAKNK